ncbi:MAG: molybdenum cofactor guanylyltransferase [Candidatus Thorarchaeota archaeon]
MTIDDLTVAILSGGNSTRFGGQKALAQFQGRPLVSHMLSIAQALSSRVLMVVSNQEQEDAIRKIAGDLEIVSDPDDSTRSALNGAVTAFEYSKSLHTLLLPIDTPLVSKGVLKTLIQLSEGHGAVIPGWPNGHVEPLHGVYLTEHAYSRGLAVLESGRRRMQDLLDKLTNVLYVSTEILKRFDPNLDSFVNINTPADLKKLEMQR